MVGGVWCVVGRFCIFSLLLFKVTVSNNFFYTFASVFIPDHQIILKCIIRGNFDQIIEEDNQLTYTSFDNALFSILLNIENEATITRGA